MLKIQSNISSLYEEKKPHRKCTTLRARYLVTDEIRKNLK